MTSSSRLTCVDHLFSLAIRANCKGKRWLSPGGSRDFILRVERAPRVPFLPRQRWYGPTHVVLSHPCLFFSTSTTSSPIRSPFFFCSILSAASRLPMAAMKSSHRPTPATVSLQVSIPFLSSVLSTPRPHTYPAAARLRAHSADSATRHPIPAVPCCSSPRRFLAPPRILSCLRSRSTEDLRGPDVVVCVLMQRRCKRSPSSLHWAFDVATLGARRCCHP